MWCRLALIANAFSISNVMSFCFMIVSRIRITATTTTKIMKDTNRDWCFFFQLLYYTDILLNMKPYAARISVTTQFTCRRSISSNSIDGRLYNNNTHLILFIEREILCASYTLHLAHWLHRFFSFVSVRFFSFIILCLFLFCELQCNEKPEWKSSIYIQQTNTYTHTHTQANAIWYRCLLQCIKII